MDILKSTPFKIIALVVALLAAVWVGVMISDGPTTNSHRQQQTQTQQQAADGQWGETSPMESSNGFKANGHGTTPEWVRAQTENALEELRGEWAFDFTEADKYETCTYYYDDPYGFVVELQHTLLDDHGVTSVGDLNAWVSSACAGY